MTRLRKRLTLWGTASLLALALLAAPISFNSVSMTPDFAVAHAASAGAGGTDNGGGSGGHEDNGGGGGSTADGGAGGSNNGNGGAGGTATDSSGGRSGR